MNADGTGLRFFPLGDRALLLAIDGEAGEASVKLVRALGEFLGRLQLPGVSDLVPALSSLGVHYDPEVWRDTSGAHSPYEMLARRIQAELPDLSSLEAVDGRLHEIPVCYENEFGEDLVSLADKFGLTPKQVVDIHSTRTYTVYMLGFAPGFVYLGQLDDRLVLPRRDTPRQRVPAGSVAVANQYTGIYPAALPGGWHIVGRTPLRMFDLSRDSPSLVSAGDRIRFVPVSMTRFRELESGQQ